MEDALQPIQFLLQSIIFMSFKSQYATFY